MEVESPEEFFELDANQDVWLQFGSQLGMGLGLSLRFEAFSEEELERVSVGLILEGEPLGLQVHEPPVLSCETDGALYLDAMVMIDVGDHPSVTSVAQLDGATATVRYVVTQDDEETFQGTVPVVLNL